ncbi:hypothetical protein ACFQVC_12535 [Streptomyces monticola]|uniref:DUF998 domain-containing protein n=1 Tax=Streptomyces monticola TaxID=2666263 RepID=A0ABW2JHJ0_9ACTN
MGQPQILTRGARTTGTVAAGLIALISLVWIVRDLAETEGPGSVWWMWSGLPAADYSGQGVGVTGLTDLVLVLVCGAVAVTAPRSPSATSALVAAGLLTVALRVPSLWILTSDWMRLWGDQDQRTQALASAGTAVGLGVVLLITAAVGRRAPDHGGYGGYGYPPAPAGPDEEPVRPGNGAAATAFLCLGAAACVRAAWEVYYVQEYGWDVYRSALTGGRNNVLSLLYTPSAWGALTVVLIALVAAVAALRHAAFSRPLGMAAATAIGLWGALGLSVAVKADLFDGLWDATLNLQLTVLSSAFYVLAGIVALLALAARGAHGPAGGAPAWDRAPASYGPPPPSSPPPGW